MRHPRRWLAASAAALVLAASGIVVRGLDFGVEFTGGRLIEYTSATPVDADRVRSALADAGFPRAVVQSSGENQLTVRTHQLSNARAAAITDTVTDLAHRGDKIRDETIGPSFGKELRYGALIALAQADDTARTAAPCRLPAPGIVSCGAAR